jgi:hypothetical protein
MNGQLARQPWGSARSPLSAEQTVEIYRFTFVRLDLAASLDQFPRKCNEGKGGGRREEGGGRREEGGVGREVA